MLVACVYTCVNFFLLHMSIGAKIWGNLPKTGIGNPIQVVNQRVKDNLKDECLLHNKTLLENMVQDRLHQELMEVTCKDASLGRMSKPVLAQELDLTQIRLHPRFAVDQGVRSNGKRKIRAVDHFSWSCHGNSKKKRKMASINGQCQVEEKLVHDHLDGLMEAIKCFIESVSACFKRLVS